MKHAVVMQTFKEVGDHGYDFESSMWAMALKACVATGRPGALFAVFGDEYGGAAEFVTGEGHAMLSVLVDGNKRTFLKNVEGRLKWGEEAAVEGSGLKFVFGQREEESLEDQEKREDKGKGKVIEPEEVDAGEVGAKESDDEGGEADTPLKSSQPEEEEGGETFGDPVALRTRAKAAELALVV